MKRGKSQCRIVSLIRQMERKGKKEEKKRKEKGRREKRAIEVKEQKRVRKTSTRRATRSRRSIKSSIDSAPFCKRRDSLVLLHIGRLTHDSFLRREERREGRYIRRGDAIVGLALPPRMFQDVESFMPTTRWLTYL